jgi:hypothetical protein
MNDNVNTAAESNPSAAAHTAWWSKSITEAANELNTDVQMVYYSPRSGQT